MAKIVILDDNKFGSAFLKLTLTRHRHRVSRIVSIQDAIRFYEGSAPDLVLVSHAFRNRSGWDAFNHLKRINPKLMVMLYALDGQSRKDADWIVEAIEAGIGEKKQKPLNRTSLIPHRSQADC